MIKPKKYTCRVVQKNDSWTAEIIRRASARKTIVSKKQHGFASQAEAQQWGEKELGLFLENLTSKNKIRADQHKEKLGDVYKSKS